MRYKNKRHTDLVFKETARRIGMPLDEFMNRPMMEVLKVMVDKGVIFGLQTIK